MMTTNRDDTTAKILVIGLVLTIIGFLAYAYFYLLKWKEEEIDVGFTKEAKKNPFLAAEMYLNRQNIETEVTRKFTFLDNLELEGRRVGEQDTIVIVDGRGAVNEKRLDPLLRWVDNGGTLVASTANPFIGLGEGDDPLLEALGLEVIEVEAEDDPLAAEPGEEETEENTGEGKPEDENKQKTLQEIFGALLVDACDPETGVTEIEFDGEEERLEAIFLPDHVISFYDHEPSGWISNDNGVVLTYHEMGSGYVYVTVDNHIWNNDRIDCLDHAYVLWQLINPQGKVWFVVNQDSPSLASMIWAASPIAVLSALLAALLWLWKSGSRLGPLYHPRRLARRGFAEHIHANAVFLWRHQHQQILVDQLKKDIALKMARRVRHFEELPKTKQLEHLEQLSGLARPEIDTAFFDAVGNNENQFLFVIKTLKQIKDRL